MGRFWALVGVIAVACMLLLGVRAAVSATNYKPNRSFAKILVAALEKKNPGLRFTAAVCTEPVLPKNSGLTVGVVSDDCLLVGTYKGKQTCGEELYSNGTTLGQPLPCKLVLKAMRKDVPKSWVVHFAARFTAEYPWGH